MLKKPVGRDVVWNAHDSSAVERFGFLATIDELHLEVIESFQNADGKLLSNHVERAALEQYQRLSAG